jgi:bacteriorhodopsin
MSTSSRPTTTPIGNWTDGNATDNSTIVIENITVVNITQLNTEYVVSDSGSGGLDQELNRLVNAFKNPSQIFQATDLDSIAAITLWTTCIFFMFFSVAISVDRSRYKRKYQNNHNMLLLIALITCLNYLTMANGHGRAMHHVIKEVKPYNLTRFCEKLNITNVSSTPAPLPPPASGRASMAQEPGSTRTKRRALGGGSSSSRPVGAADSDAADDGAEEEDLCKEGIVKYRFMSAVATAKAVPLDPPFFYGKYIQWLITTNLTLYLLCRSVAHANKRITLFAMAFNSMMIVCGLCAESLRTDNIEAAQIPRYITSKWVYWVFGMVFYVMLLSVLNRAVRRAANQHRSRPDLANAFNVLFFSLCVR